MQRNFLKNNNKYMQLIAVVDELDVPVLAYWAAALDFLGEYLLR